MHNLKKWLFGLLILCLLVSLAPASFAEGTSPSPEAAAKEVEFPLAFDRATGDGITAIAADGQGTIIVVSNSSYLNVTNDNGKSGFPENCLPVTCTTFFMPRDGSSYPSFM